MTEKKEYRTFEEAYTALEAIVRAMEDPKITFEENLEYYAQAAELQEICRRRLAEAKTKITQISDRLRECEDAEIPEE